MWTLAIRFWSQGHLILRPKIDSLRPLYDPGFVTDISAKCHDIVLAELQA